MVALAGSESFERELVRLCDVPVGSTVEVVMIESSPIAPKLRAIGVLPGVKVEVLRAAPMGEPRMYRIFNKVITLRNSESSVVLVRPAEDSPLSLLQAPPGKYRVVRIDGGWVLRNRLSTMGISVDSDIVLLPDRRVQTSEGIFTLGVGRLSKVIVRRIEDQW